MKIATPRCVRALYRTVLGTVQHMPVRCRHRLLAATVTAAAALLAACTTVQDGQGSTALSAPAGHASARPSSSGSSSAAPTQPPAEFRDCRGQFALSALTFPAGRRNRLSFECATIDVPLDYAKPAGRTIELRLIKIHDSANTVHTGSLIMNPGGPGGSGVDLALGLSAQLSDQVLAHFDLVGFDPRGVGLSTPVRCLTDAQQDELNAASPDVRTAAGFAAAKSAAAMVARTCSSKYGNDLPQFNTVQTAMDMDQIRQAVGDSRMNYLGFSYGTELGGQYAHLFPGRIRAMVLDGAVNPLTGDITAFADQLQGFEGAFDQFAAWCKAQSHCSTLGDPRTAVYDIAASAQRTPIPSDEPGETREATSSLVYLGVLSALYAQQRWPELGSALTEARDGNSAGLLRLADEYNERYDGHYTNLSDANRTIGCNDSKIGPTDATIRQTTAEWVKRYPMFGLWSAAALFTCQQWQPRRTIPPLPTAKRAAETILVVGNLHDPATPYQGAKDLTATLGRARLLSWDGEGHTSYLQGSGCVDDAVNSYLITATLPPAGKTCPPR